MFQLDSTSEPGVEVHLCLIADESMHDANRSDTPVKPQCRTRGLCSRQTPTGVVHWCHRQVTLTVCKLWLILMILTKLEWCEVDSPCVRLCMLYATLNLYHLGVTYISSGGLLSLVSPYITLPTISNEQHRAIRKISQVAKFMGPTRGPHGSCRPQMDPMLIYIYIRFCFFAVLSAK